MRFRHKCWHSGVWRESASIWIHWLAAHRGEGIWIQRCIGALQGENCSHQIEEVCLDMVESFDMGNMRKVFKKIFLPENYKPDAFFFQKNKK